MNKKYRNSKGIISNIEYNVVFCTRYKRKIFDNEHKVNCLKETLIEVANKNNISILDIKVYSYYVYLKIDCPPDLSPNSIMSRLREETSKRIRGEFEDLKHLQSMWIRNYLIANKDLNKEDIEEFLLSQKIKG